MRDNDEYEDLLEEIKDYYKYPESYSLRELVNLNTKILHYYIKNYDDKPQHNVERFQKWILLSQDNIDEQREILSLFSKQLFGYYQIGVPLPYVHSQPKIHDRVYRMELGDKKYKIYGLTDNDRKKKSSKAKPKRKVTKKSKKCKCKK